MLGSRPAFIEIRVAEERLAPAASCGRVPAGDSLLSLEEICKTVDTCADTHTSAILNRKGILEGGLIVSGIAVRTADKNG